MLSSLTVSDPLTLEPKQLKKLLCACNVQIHALLHMETVFPYLVQENLLTQGEKDKLCSLSSFLSSDESKITYLVERVLPKKGRTVLPRFLKCLESTASGTAHKELAEFIKTKGRELSKEDAKHFQNGTKLSATIATLSKLRHVRTPFCDNSHSKYGYCSHG